MKLSRIFLRQASRDFYERLLQGRWESLTALALFGLVVMGFLFATVHRRDLEAAISQQYGSAAGRLDRYPDLIRFWIEQGYLEHGGLWFILPGDIGYIDEDHPRVYRSAPMAYLQVAHLLERVCYAVKGKISYTALMLHNQGIVWLSSTLLGVLAMRLARRMKIDPLHALLLGAASTAVYQTFPINLWYYWEIYATAVAAPFIILFLLIQEITYGREPGSRFLTMLLSLCVFALASTDLLAAWFIFIAYCLAALTMAPESVKKLPVLKTLIVPAILACSLFALQVLWVKLRYPNVEFVGSTFMFRSGLDGSKQVYATHVDLVTRPLVFDFLPQMKLLTRPWFLFGGGGLAVLTVAWLYLTRLPQLKPAVFVLTIAVGVYLPYVFIFSQSAIIHPYMYDVYLAIPLTLALFAVLPAALERLTNNSGLITFAALLIALCYVMVQLRTYAIVFPLPEIPSGW